MEGRRIGRFLAERPLKAGGMGAIFVARDVVLDRLVALKVLPASLEADGERRAWLLREARAAASISHPNVATIFEAGHDAGTVYLAMELVVGEDLSARLRRGALSLEELRHIGLGIAAGLGAAHAAGVLHRDLKPANVMIPEGGAPKLVDFGLARPPSRRDEGLQSLTGRIGGTPGYMPPEQIRGEPADARTDLFALGVLLFEAWTGRSPFGHDGMDALVRTLDGERPSVTSLRATPAALVQLLDRLLAPARAARPESVREVSAVLEALDRGGPVVVRPAMTAEGAPTSPPLELAAALASTRPPATDPHAPTAGPGELALPESRPASAAPGLVGRAEAVQRVLDVLGQFSRLVTVTGPPGIGKTAVAREVTSQLRARGERVVERALDDVHTPADLRTALGALANETGVIHLDGGEAVAAELAAQLERWLPASPARFLVSGRARLDLPEEVVVELGPLAPEAAAELFTVRACRSRAALASDPELPAAARSIAAALGGHPLALVLAATRASLLAPSEIAARAAAQPLALVGEPAARSPGLREALARSLAPRSPDERALLHALALFEEPFEAASAEAIAQTLAPKSDGLGAVDRLHRVSLLGSVAGPEGLFLAIDRVVREVLREQPAPSGPLPAAAFAAQLVALARRGVLTPGLGRALVHAHPGSLARAAELSPPEGRAWITVLMAFQRPGPEHQPALERALAAGPSPELACAVELALVARQMERDVGGAARLAQQGLERALGHDAALVALARTLCIDALLRAHRHDEAAQAAEAMLAEARRSGRVGDEVDALERLGTLNWRRARHDEGLAQLRRALELAEALRDRGRQAAVLLSWGILLVQERRFAEARGLYERAGALARAVHMERLGAVLANNLGVILHEENDLSGAQAAFSETHALALRADRPFLAAIGLLNRGMLLHEGGDLEGAAADLDAAIAGAAALGETRYRVLALGARAAVRADRGEVGGAEDDLAAASALLGASPERQLALALSVRAAHVELSLARRSGDPVRLAAARRTAAAFRDELADPQSPIARSENARMAMRQLGARHPA